MKIKIKDPSITLGSHFWISCLYIVLFIIIFIPLLQDKGAFSWAAYNQISAEICEGEGLMCVLVFKVLPWGFLLLLGMPVYSIYRAFFSTKAKSNQLRTAEFLPEGVKLEYTKQPFPVLLPYQETEFILTAKCAMVSNKYASFPKVIFCEFTFLQEDKKYSFRHSIKNAIPTLTELLKKESAFKKFELKVESVSDMPNYTTATKRAASAMGIISSLSDKQAADSIRTRLEDFRKYGLMCRFSAEEREMIVYFIFLLLFLTTLSGYGLYQLPGWLPFACLAIFLSTSLWLISLWYKDKQILKRLNRLKRKK